MKAVYTLVEPKVPFVPVLLSIPHVGTSFPQDLEDHYVPDLAKKPDDTDFYLDRLYDFASDLGVTTIYANYSRWLIDLNRTADNQSLYQDGRMITSLCPITDFKGNPIYLDKSLEPDSAEIERRKAHYYFPYYEKIQEILTEWRKVHPHVLFWDAHSIREYVRSIQADKFPQLILGNNDEKSAATPLIRTARESLKSQGHELTHNTPFKGGNLTRHFGKPEKGIHALQLEMIKTLYMDDQEENYAEDRAEKLKVLLKHSFQELIKTLLQL